MEAIPTKRIHGALGRAVALILVLAPLLSVGVGAPALASGCTTTKPAAPAGYSYQCVPPQYVEVTTPGYWTTKTVYKTETVMAQKTEQVFVPGYWTTKTETLRTYVPGHYYTVQETEPVRIHGYWYNTQQTMQVSVPGYWYSASEYVPGHEGCDPYVHTYCRPWLYAGRTVTVWRYQPGYTRTETMTVRKYQPGYTREETVSVQKYQPGYYKTTQVQVSIYHPAASKTVTTEVPERKRVPVPESVYVPPVTKRELKAGTDYWKLVALPPKPTYTVPAGCGPKTGHQNQNGNWSEYQTNSGGYCWVWHSTAQGSGSEGSGSGSGTRTCTPHPTGQTGTNGQAVTTTTCTTTTWSGNQTVTQTTRSTSGLGLSNRYTPLRQAIYEVAPVQATCVDGYKVTSKRYLAETMTTYYWNTPPKRVEKTVDHTYTLADSPDSFIVKTNTKCTSPPPLHGTTVTKYQSRTVYSTVDPPSTNPCTGVTTSTFVPEKRTLTYKLLYEGPKLISKQLVGTGPWTQSGPPFKKTTPAPAGFTPPATCKSSIAITTKPLGPQRKTVTLKTVAPTCTAAGYTLVQDEQRTGTETITSTYAPQDQGGGLLSRATKDTWGAWKDVGGPTKTDIVAAGTGVGGCTVQVTRPVTRTKATVVAPTCTTGGYTLDQPQSATQYGTDDLTTGATTWKPVPSSAWTDSGSAYKTNKVAAGTGLTCTAQVTRPVTRTAKTVVAPTCTTGGYTLNQPQSATQYGTDDLTTGATTWKPIPASAWTDSGSAYKTNRTSAKTCSTPVTRSQTRTRWVESGYQAASCTANGWVTYAEETSVRTDAGEKSKATGQITWSPWGAWSAWTKNGQTQTDVIADTTVAGCGSSAGGGATTTTPTSSTPAPPPSVTVGSGSTPKTPPPVDPVLTIYPLTVMTDQPQTDSLAYMEKADAVLKVAPGWTITSVNMTFVDQHAEVNGNLNSTACMNLTTCDWAWPEATWTYKGSEAEGAFTEGWNWWAGYWDPAMNSPGVVTNHTPDEVVFTVQYTVAGFGTTRTGQTSTVVGVLGSVLYPRLGPWQS